MPLHKFNVLNRWSGDLQFTATIDCDETAPPRIKLGLAVRYAYLSGANLSDADLRGAYLSGADLSGTNLSGANLRGANLSGAYLSGADLSGTNLSGANLRGADLRGANLSGADLSGTNLRGANLRGADLRGANLSVSDAPAIPALDSKILAAIEGGGKLDMSSWHSCETSHCRAGWAIIQAGEEGRKLEAKFGSAAAGAMIYAKSYPNMKIPNFYATDEEAMEDMRARAAQDPKVLA